VGLVFLKWCSTSFVVASWSIDYLHDLCTWIFANHPSILLALLDNHPGASVWRVPRIGAYIHQPISPWLQDHCEGVDQIYCASCGIISPVRNVKSWWSKIGLHVLNRRYLPTAGTIVRGWSRMVHQKTTLWRRARIAIGKAHLLLSIGSLLCHNN
jgi:hypothetical protein